MGKREIIELLKRYIALLKRHFYMAVILQKPRQTTVILI